MNPTDEQLAILAEAANTKTNILISALAGTGKTTTLEMIEKVVSKQPILYLAFNRKIADDASKRMLSTTTVRTFNGMGHRIWARSISKNLALNPKKTQDLLRSLIDEVPRKEQAPMWDSFWEVVSGVGMAKSLGYIPNGKFPQAKRLCIQSTLHAALDETPDDFTSDLIDAVLFRSIKAAYAGNIDYNDQVYMPALFSSIVPQFPLVKVDEAQDLNPVNHALVDKLARGRLISVGDDAQSIYWFRGAMQGGMASLASRFKAEELHLSISFRCPQAIVENARWRVPNFKWIKEGGHVEVLEKLPAGNIPDECTFLCRNNAPLFRLALQLLSAGHSVQVSGSDIGPKLIAILRRLGPGDSSQSTVLHCIDSWAEEKLAKGSTTAEDIAASMKVFAGFGDTLDQAVAYAEHLFAQKGTIKLMTGHKAKGLEFPIVIHLDPWLIREDQQDQNLKYVIQTRSLDQYYEVDSRDIKWS